MRERNDKYDMKYIYVCVIEWYMYVWYVIFCIDTGRVNLEEPESVRWASQSSPNVSEWKAEALAPNFLSNPKYLSKNLKVQVLKFKRVRSKTVTDAGPEQSFW